MKSKEIDIENCACYYSDDMIVVTDWKVDFDFNDFFLRQKII